MTHKFFHRLISLFLALAITFVGVTSALAADGSLDPTFGTGGIVTTDFGGSNDVGNDVALQPDGKIVVAGSSGNYPDDFALARYNNDGSLDTTFDTDGKVTTDFGGSNDVGNDIALQPDGKIIVAGNSLNDTDDFALARYNGDGSLDPTFDADGKVTTDFGNSNEVGYAVALQPDAKIIVAGIRYSSNPPNITSDFALARYNSDGSLDTTFDADGIVTTDFENSNEVGYAVALQPDAKIIVAGVSDNSGNNLDFAVVRYNSDGSLDTTFDTDGIVTTDFGRLDTGSAVALQPDGKIVVAGSSAILSNNSTSNVAVARYNSDGSPDTTFDTDGKVTTDFGGLDFGSNLALQLDGKILVSGQSDSGINLPLASDFALVRYNSDGSLDATFDTDGKVTTDFGSSHDFGSAVALQPDNKIIVAGNSYGGTLPNSTYDFALARYDGDGSAMEVTIDVKPGRLPNRIELEKNVCKDDDNLYVAILTTPDFDALTVDASTLQLGDPNLSGTVSPVRSRANDVDSDGDNDLALAFSLCDLVTSEALNTSTTELVLTGSTLDGISFTGRDSVKVPRDD